MVHSSLQRQKVAGSGSPGARRSLRGWLSGKSLGVAAASSGELIRRLERGFAFRTLQTFQARSGLTVSQIASIVGIPERTLARRKASGRLTSDESERLLRISSIFEKAVSLFEGDVPGAVSWLNTPRKEFSDRAPLDYARTEPGAREVEDLMGRLEHGIFS